MKTKNISYISLFLLLAGILITGCEKNDSVPSVYMPEAKDMVISTFNITDTLSYSAMLVGADYPTASVTNENNITVTFKIDNNLISSANQSLGTNYRELSANSYEFQSSGTISIGETGTPALKLIIKNGEELEAFNSYLIPISIDQVSGAQVSEFQKTTYFVATRSPSLEELETFDRTNWSIVGFSTEEPAEGGGNGLAIDVLDDDLGTYWHSQWSGGEPEPPHYITIDMGEPQTVHGISIIDRYFEGDWATSGHGQPKAIKVSVSTDGTNWVDNGTFQVPLPPVDDPQSEIRFFLPAFQTARYLKITVTSAWETNSTNIAEIMAL